MNKGGRRPPFFTPKYRRTDPPDHTGPLGPRSPRARSLPSREREAPGTRPRIEGASRSATPFVSTLTPRMEKKRQDQLAVPNPNCLSASAWHPPRPGTHAHVDRHPSTPLAPSPDTHAAKRKTKTKTKKQRSTRVCGGPRRVGNCVNPETCLDNLAFPCKPSFAIQRLEQPGNRTPVTKRKNGNFRKRKTLRQHETTGTEQPSHAPLKTRYGLKRNASNVVQWLDRSNAISKDSQMRASGHCFQLDGGKCFLYRVMFSICLRDWALPVHLVKRPESLEDTVATQPQRVQMKSPL